MYRRQTGGRMSGTGSPATYATNAAVFQSRNETLEQDGVFVDLSVLDLNSLKKYKKLYRLRTRHNNATKAEIVQAVVAHFKTMPAPNEEETIESFFYAVKQ